MIGLDAFELDLATADAIVALVDERVGAEAVDRLGGGANSAVFAVRRRDGSTVVVKLYSDFFHWKMQKEVFVYDRLREHGVVAPVPTVLAADDSKTLVPQNVIVMTKLDGRRVYSILDQLHEDDFVAIDRQIGGLLRTLHEVGFDEFGYVGTHGVVDPHPTNLEYMRFQFDKKLRGFAEYGGDVALRRAIERHVAEREVLLRGCARAVLCHDDCHYGNVLVARDGRSWRLSGLCDFENVVAGDPLLDLAKTHCYSPRRSAAMLAALAEDYGELRDGWRETLDLYVLYHWLELWDWLAFASKPEPLPAIADEMRLLVAGRIP